MQTLVTEKIPTLEFIKKEFPKATIFPTKITDADTIIYHVFHNITFHTIEIPVHLAKRPFDLANELQRLGLAGEMRKAISINAKFVITEHDISFQPLKVGNLTQAGNPSLSRTIRLFSRALTKSISLRGAKHVIPSSYQRQN